MREAFPEDMAAPDGATEVSQTAAREIKGDNFHSTRRVIVLIVVGYHAADSSACLHS